MRFKKIFLSLFILILGLYLRLDNYDKYPQRGSTSDEYAFAFLGVSLITKRVPIAWSAIPLYKEKVDLRIDNLYFPIVNPYLDHPPLFGLLVGGWALLFSERTFFQISLSTIRIVPILLSTISGGLLFLLGRKLYGFKVGLWALLIFSTSTLFIVNSRVVVAETLLTSLLLSGLILFDNFSSKFKQKSSLILGIISGFAFLTKVLGVVVFLTLLYLLLDRKVIWKNRAIFVGSFLFFILVFIAYGVYYGGDLFWKVQAYQSARNLGSETLWTLLFKPTIVNKVFFDGWYFWGFFSLFYLFNKFDKHKFIILPTIIYILLLLVSVNQTDLHGWYALPLFPFLSLSSAVVLHKISKKINWIMLVFILLIGVSQIRLLYESNFGLTPGVFRLISTLLFGPILLVLYFRKNNIYTILVSSLFYIFILNSIIVTLQYIHPS